MKRKIKITQRQYNALSKAYRFGGFAIILGLLVGFSWLISKPIEFIFIFLPYFLTKGFYTRQYHSRSLRECFILSLGIFSLAVIACVPYETSISFSVLLGLVIAFISYKAGVVQFKLKDYEYIEPRYNQLVDFYKTATEQKPLFTSTWRARSSTTLTRQYRAVKSSPRTTTPLWTMTRNNVSLL